ncbi:hypothetical protein AGMMS50262_15910 [Bacteroidia bacterium]|nr:hypothetical protein AGMMS50262_15910 [Bacteroidia bacterium]
MKQITSFSGFISMYIEGFKNLTWGKSLWIIILIKLFILFAVLKIFFFPNYLNSRFDTEKEKSESVFQELTRNRNTNTN